MPARNFTVFSCDKCDADLGELPPIAIQTVKEHRPFTQFFCEKDGKKLLDALKAINA